MTRVWAAVRVPAVVAAGFVLGWATCLAQGLMGGKHLTWREFRSWLSWSGVSPDKQDRIRREDADGDWTPEDEWSLAGGASGAEEPA